MLPPCACSHQNCLQAACTRGLTMIGHKQGKRRGRKKSKYRSHTQKMEIRFHQKRDWHVFRVKINMLLNTTHICTPTHHTLVREGKCQGLL